MAWKRYVAVGDSFTEGIGDPAPGGRHVGWADRVAAEIARRQGDFAYANLAIRGRRLGPIVDEQIPEALALEPDLVSIAGGVNDALRKQWDLGAVADSLRRGVQELRSAGVDVVIVTFGQPDRRSRVLGTVTERLAEYRQEILQVTEESGCMLVDFWNDTVFDDPRFWSGDRLHLNSEGHRRVALAVLEELGMPSGDWRAPLPEVRPKSLAAKTGGDLMWAGKHLGPWLGRRVTGRSSGDGVVAKRPELRPVESGRSRLDPAHGATRTGAGGW